MIKEGLKDSASTHDVPTPVMLSGSKVLSGEGKSIRGRRRNCYSSLRKIRSYRLSIFI
jgi:hypothetical protein